MFALLVQLQGQRGVVSVMGMAGLLGNGSTELLEEPSSTQIAKEEKKATQGYCEVRDSAKPPPCRTIASTRPLTWIYLLFCRTSLPGSHCDQPPL